MDAPAFLHERAARTAPRALDWFFALIKTLAGGVLVGIVAGRVPAEHALWRDWVVLIGLGLCVPFGALHLVALAWQAAGVTARPIMDSPFVAGSLGEFWGRRWNLAFRDAAYVVVYRPLTARVGARGAVAATFLFSALVHELTLSVPAGGGFGLPSVYFLLQLIGVRFERSSIGQRLGLRRGWRGRLFCRGMTILPAPLVFHRPLLDNVLFPWLHTLNLL
jgi:alginate O-acetyltransferase complex protein AlgI